MPLPASPQTEAAQSRREWTTVISPRGDLLTLDLAELWRYRDLVALFVRRDFVATYKQTVLGPLWFLIQPLLTALVYTVVFGRMARLSTDGIPHVLFYMCGAVLWRYFSECLTKTSTTFSANAGIFGKVYFPRLAVPLSIVLSGLITLGFQFLVFLGLLGCYALGPEAVVPGPLILITPLLVLMLAALGLGLGLTVTALTVKYRDLRYLVSFAVQLFMFATPVIYPLSMVPERWRALAALNPLAPVLEAMRLAWLGSGDFSWARLGVAAAEIAVILLAGCALFSVTEKTFVDTV